MGIEFKAFDKIQNIDKSMMTITQKLHGTNAQIYIYEEGGELKLKPGSRTRWLTPDDDNYGFARFVIDNKQAFIDTLGVGRHFGEWCGPGINSGEGLKEKTLVLFNWRRWKDIPLPPKVTTVPVLYTGSLSMEKVEEVFNRLKEQGSYFSPGFMRPEGIVIDINGMFFKKVFDPEETAWKKADKPKTIERVHVDVSHLLQPLRLEKLLSRDERYARDYPKSIETICKDYIQDLEDEGFFSSDEGIRKTLSTQCFKFIKTVLDK
jgi:hypothetical protein